MLQKAWGSGQRTFSTPTGHSPIARHWNSSEPRMLAARHGWFAFWQRSTAAPSCPARTCAYSACVTALSYAYSKPVISVTPSSESQYPSPFSSNCPFAQRIFRPPFFILLARRGKDPTTEEKESSPHHRAPAHQPPAPPTSPARPDPSPPQSRQPLLLSSHTARDLFTTTQTTPLLIIDQHAFQV